MKRLTLTLLLALAGCGGGDPLPPCDPHNYQDRGIVFTQVPGSDPPEFTCVYTD